LLSLVVVVAVVAQAPVLLLEAVREDLELELDFL